MSDLNDWCERLDTNHFGRKVLTLTTALAMAEGGASDHWYVAPFATAWTVGRCTRDGEAYHILLEDEDPIWFPTRRTAMSFVDTLIASRGNGSGIESAALRWMAASRDPARDLKCEA